MRRLVLIGWLAGSGCFYAPVVADCAVACTDSCPAGLSCVDGLCTAGTSCECQNGLNRICGITRGACKAGNQSCGAGAWGSCVGELTGSPEVCDGVDNDCDGLTDQFTPVVVHEGSTRDWRWIALDAGYALVVTAPGDAGDEVTSVRRLGPAFEPLEITTARVGPPATGEAVGLDSTVYLAWLYDGGVSLGAVTDGQLSALEGVEDAGAGFKFELAVNDERLLAHWDRPGAPSTRLGRWTRAGQLTDVTDFATVDAGYELTDGFTPVLSSRGKYAVYTVTAPADAGLTENLRMVIDTSSLELLRIDAPYYQYDQNDSRLVEMPSGALACVYTYIYTPTSWSGIYLNPNMLTLDTADELAVEEIKTNALAWGNSDAVVDAQGRLSFVYMDNAGRRLVLARSVGATLMQPVTKRPQQATEGFGVPRLAAPNAAGFLPLAWNDQTRITARLVCPVR